MNLIKIYFIISLLKAFLFQSDQYNVQESLIYLQAKKEGYNLSDPNDIFFLDICIFNSYNGKDITLDLKRKYFFFPDQKNIEYHFNNPQRNDTTLCFMENIEFSNLFKNMAFLLLFPMLIFQTTFILLSLLIHIDKSFNNTPFSKMEMLKKNKFFCFLCKSNKNRKKKVSNFSEFSPEVSIPQPDNSEKNDTVNDLIIKESIRNEEKEQENSIDNNKNFTDSKNPHIKTINNDRKNSNDLKNDSSNEGLKAKTDFDEEKKDNEENDNNEDINENKDIKVDRKTDEIDITSPIEKSIDNYTFGMDIQIGKMSEKEGKKSLSSQRKENKLKKVALIFNSINEERNKKININTPQNNYFPTFKKDKNKNITNKIEYIREEYFYFGYLLARIEDKRSVFQIYLDLLEQCQIIFKLFLIPFNIFEDSNLQIVYYGIKFELYLFFNSLLITDNVINNIYINTNTFIDDLFRSLLSSIYAYIIGLFIYFLTHIKKTLIRRRYQFLNLRITEQRLKEEVYKLSNKICIDYLSNKLIILITVFIMIYSYIFYFCYSFCSVYKNTQKYVLKGVFLSIIISQISPFFLCFIPAFIRKIAISKKQAKIYKLTKLIELLFIA